MQNKKLTYDDVLKEFIEVANKFAELSNKVKKTQQTTSTQEKPLTVTQKVHSSMRDNVVVKYSMAGYTIQSEKPLDPYGVWSDITFVKNGNGAQNIAKNPWRV